MPSAPATRPVTDPPDRAAPLAGRHAVITGAGSGIGSAVAARLHALGARLTLMGRRFEPLERRCAALAGAAAVVVDVTCEAAVGRAFETARARLGPVDILVNNAGAAESAPLARTDAQLWARMLAVNLTGSFLCAREVLPDMVARGRGRVVNVASTAGLKGYPYVSAYCAAKHGVIGLTRALAAETARAAVTVNAVCPGYTDTPLLERAVERVVERTGRAPEAARAELARANPQGRLVRPQQVAGAVAWLCLPESDAVTGQAIVVAGGEIT